MYNLKDADVKEQKQCPPEITPNYETGPTKITKSKFHKQQFDMMSPSPILFVRISSWSYKTILRR